MLTGMAMVLALVLATLVLPLFNQISGKHFGLFAFFDGAFLPWLFVVVLITGLVSGSYPAFFLSAFQPVHVLKGRTGASGRGSVLRRLLVVLQFGLTALLLFSTSVVYKQLQYIQNKDMGFQGERVLSLRVRGEMKNNLQAARTEWLKHPGIIQVAMGSHQPVETGDHRGGLSWPGKDPAFRPGMYFYSVDENYLETLGMRLVQGRGFLADHLGDKDHVLINEAAARFMNLSDPVGQPFSYWGRKSGRIIGVVKDFHFESVKKKVEPMVLTLSSSANYLFLKVRPEGLPATLAHVQSVWERFCPGTPMDARYLDVALQGLYRSEYKMGMLFKIFTGLAIFLSSMGLLGLASFIAQRRTKEIGIRKVLGASSWGVTGLLMRDFVFLALIANSVAAFPAYWFMKQWLQGWAHHTAVDPELFALTIGVVLVLVCISVGFQSLRAANTNPVRSLKSE